MQPVTWLSLAIGNSRLHWAEFVDDRLQRTWHTAHLSTAEVQQHIQEFEERSSPPELWIASVVPTQNQWQSYSRAHLLQREQVPLEGMYPTLGIDRALALWGAITTISSPILVIDAGTALTFTGADGKHTLVGGAILPGLWLQFKALGQGTAALPALPADSPLPPRWARNTPDAIASGILHTVLAGVRSFIADWQQQFPGGAVVLTGGDGDRLHQLLTQQFPELGEVKIDPHLIFWGCRAVREQILAAAILRP
jgi:type III pantothenate kinase